MHRQVQQWNKPQPKKVDPTSFKISKIKFDIVKKGNKDIFIRESMLSSLVARQLLDWFKDLGSYSTKLIILLTEKQTLDNFVPPYNSKFVYMSTCNYINV